MTDLIALPDRTLVEVRLWELFPVEYAKDIHAFVPRNRVLEEVVDRLGYRQVDEDDIAEYAAASRQDPSHWEKGSGRRFLMAPIIKRSGSGVVTYVGPYEDTGEHGYELGLWRTVYTEKPEDERYPQTAHHPVQVSYRVLSTLVAKRIP